MLPVMNRVPVLCLTVLLLAVQSLARQELTAGRLAGTYVVGHMYGGGSRTLEPDRRYSAGGGSDDGTVIKESGTYVLSGGVLRFTILKLTGSRNHSQDEKSLLDPNGRKEILGESASGDTVREYAMLPVTWSDRIYLLNEGDLKDFANAINFGLEPRSSLTQQSPSEPYYGSFYLRKGDEQKKIKGNPSLPKEWLAFLLRKPVTATVTSIQESKKAAFMTSSVATISRGRRDGLKVGMRLVAKGEEPSTSFGTEVISVEEETAKVRSVRVSTSLSLNVGDKLSTRYEPGEPYR